MTSEQHEDLSSRYERIEKKLLSLYESSLLDFIEAQENPIEFWDGYDVPLEVRARQHVLTQVSGILYLSTIDLSFRLHMIKLLAEHSISIIDGRVAMRDKPTELHQEEKTVWLEIREII